MGYGFAVVPAKWLDGFRRWFQPALAWVVSAVCIGLLVASSLWGLDLRP